MSKQSFSCGLLGTAMPLALVYWLAIASAADVLAQGPATVDVRQFDHGAIVATPSDGTYSKANELRAIVDTRWANNYGYRPIRVRILSRQAAKSEQRITFRLHIAGSEQQPLEVEQSFDLPQGAKEAEMTLRVPEFHGDDRCWWSVWVDGTRDRELSLDESESWNIGATGNTRSLGTTLNFFLVKDSARSRRLVTSTSEPIATTTFGLADLPIHWIDYSAVDVVVLGPTELTQLQATRLKALTALRRWVHAGGQLWVHSIGANWDELAEVERCLDIESTLPLPEPLSADGGTDTVRGDESVIARGWRPIPIATGSGSVAVRVQHIPSGRTRTVSDPASIARLKLDPTYNVTNEPVRSLPLDAIAEKDSARWYLERPVGMGRVRIFRGGWDPVGFSMAWRLLGGGMPNQPPFEPIPKTPVTAAIDTTRDWQARHGLTPGLANADFADFLIPGVGLAPVTEFRVLITLFVLVIGPLNYWLLMRVNRLHLLLLTVPALSLALTASLFGYAVVSDGLRAIVRVRSFTLLDQNTGDAATWARLSYYAGLAPGEGLSFDEDVAVYPILSGWEHSGDKESEAGNELHLRGGRQHFAKGWLRSRTPAQFLTVRARQSPARLQLKREEDRLQVTNKLGSRILYLAVVDEAGNLLTGQHIDEDASVAVETATHNDGLRVLRELMLQNRPTMPPELAAARPASTNQSSQRQQYFRRRASPDFGLEQLSENTMNASIASIVDSNAETVVNIPRRSYIAVTETNPEVDLGLADVEEEASFHVIQGNW